MRNPTGHGGEQQDRSGCHIGRSAPGCCPFSEGRIRRKLGIRNGKGLRGGNNNNNNNNNNQSDKVKGCTSAPRAGKCWMPSPVSSGIFTG